VSAVPRAYREAAERWGYLAEGQAHKYGQPNGATLLVKIASGESGFKMGAVSSAGAKGATQFIPSTRQSYISQYGVDPWKSPDEAIHATALFLKHTGFAGYNPGGGQGYISYILGQPVSVGRQKSSHPNAMPPPPSSSAAPSSSSSSVQGDLMHVGLVGVLVLGGAGLILFGTTRVLGTKKAASP
jgi:hypothetical protein